MILMISFLKNDFYLSSSKMKLSTTLILLACIIIIVVIHKYYELNQCEATDSTQVNPSALQSYVSSCENLPKAIYNALDNHKIIEGDEENWQYYLPCAYTFCETNILKFENIEDSKNLYILDGCDSIASKVTIWSLIKNKFGSKAHEIMPETFILSDQLDFERFRKFYEKRKIENENNKFILKNFKQRQIGLKLVNSLDEISKGVEDNFKVVQDYLENPYTVSGHKINLRYYILITCFKGQINGYIFDDGFLYYTPEKFEKYSMDTAKNITTGYIDRKIYDENPLTIKQFRKHIGSKKSLILEKQVKEKFNKIMSALSEKICSNKKLSNHYKFQLFGSDIAPDENLNVTLMEMNKGPDLGYKSDEDGELKRSLVNEMFQIAKSHGRFIKDESNQFKSRFMKIY